MNQLIGWVITSRATSPGGQHGALTVQLRDICLTSRTHLTAGTTTIIIIIIITIIIIMLYSHRSERHLCGLMSCWHLAVS